jgi:hypothetical protein
VSDQAFQAVIAKFEEDLQKHEAEVSRIKRTINDLCRMAGGSPRYSDAELDPASSAGRTLRSDEYYGQPLASAVRAILERRRAAGQGAATVAQLYDELVSGGYEFETKDANNAKRGLRISLTKNPIFHRVPNGSYGMKEWYPAVKERKTNGSTQEEGNEEQEEQKTNE